jgi:DNA-directed RNA polymerase subunit RPC12/RpoP
MDDARQCKNCDYRWLARREPKPMKPTGAGAGWELVGAPGMAAGASTKAVGKYQEKLAKYERWRRCPRCGSKSVKSVTNRRGFVPSDQVQAASPMTVVNVHPAAPAVASDAMKTCGCGTALSPAWRFCPMCGAAA